MDDLGVTPISGNIFGYLWISLLDSSFHIVSETMWLRKPQRTDTL
jgi:hypothetical protein